MRANSTACQHPVQRYFRAVLKDGQPIIAAATFELAGRINMSDTGGEDWKPFTSWQRAIVQRPGFLLNGHKSMFPGLVGARTSDKAGARHAARAARKCRQSGAHKHTSIDAVADHILPVSLRAAGLRSDTAASKNLQPAALESIHLPTLIISARDDRYGTFASAKYTAERIAEAKFIGFETGGHTWVGHDDEAQAAIVELLLPPDGR